MLIAEDTCGRWLGLCWYDDIDIGLAPFVLPRQMSWQTEARDGQDLRSPNRFVLADLCLVDQNRTTQPALAC